MEPEDILTRVIETLGLTDAANRASKRDPSVHAQAISAITTILKDPAAQVSDAIYVPGGSGIVRVVLSKTKLGVEVSSIDYTPEGSPAQFSIES